MSDFHDTFREVEAGDCSIEVNSKSMASSRFVDHNRMGTRKEWLPSGNPSKPGKVVEVRNSLGDAARQAAGALRSRSVFKDRGDSMTRATDNYPMPCSYDGNGPLTRRRGDD